MILSIAGHRSFWPVANTRGYRARDGGIAGQIIERKLRLQELLALPARHGAQMATWRRPDPRRAKRGARRSLARRPRLLRPRQCAHRCGLERQKAVTHRECRGTFYVETRFVTLDRRFETLGQEMATAHDRKVHMLHSIGDGGADLAAVRSDMAHMPRGSNRLQHTFR
jgi:hypothetical protein